MQPITEPRARKRGLVDRVAIVLLFGVAAVSVGGVALLTVYLDRIGSAAAELNRVEALGAYEGRPAPVTVDGMEAVNYLLMTKDGDSRLQSVLIAHLSASRQHLTLIAIAPDLLVADGVGHTRLADTYRADPLRTAKAVETLTGARMDHQVHLDVGRFSTVVDTLGGLEVPGRRLTGAEVTEYLSASSGSLRRSERTAELMRASLSKASMGTAITDPARFDKVMKALTPCVTVDSGLTSAVIRDTMMESRVEPSEILTWPLAASSTAGGSVPVPAGLDLLRSALASDSFPPATQTSRLPGTPAPLPTR